MNKYFIFLFAAVCLLFFRLGQPNLYILDEVRNAQAAREMYQSENFIVPTFNGELRGHKPPLHYYFMIASYKLFGVHTWSARFFSGVMGLFTLWVTWFFIKRFQNEKIAWFTICILLSSLHFLFEFRLSVPDPYLIFYTTLGLFTMYAYLVENRIFWLLISAISLALATLSKGPVALLLPVASIFAWLFFWKKRKRLLDINWLLFAFIYLIVAVPWFWLIHIKTDGVFTKIFFLEHNLNRFSSAMEGHGGIFLITIAYIFIGMLPFSIFLPRIIKKIATKRVNSLVSYAIIISLVYILFFSISSTKLPNYHMPMYPFIAFILGNGLNEYFKNTNSKITFLSLLFLNLLFLVGSYLAIRSEPSVFHLSHLAVIFIIPIVFSILLYKKNFQIETTFHTMVIGYFLFNSAFLFWAYPNIYNRNPINNSISLLSKSDTVYAYKQYNPAYNFYLINNIKVLEDTFKLQEANLKNPNLRVITRYQYFQLLKTSQLKIIFKEKDLFELSETIILSKE